MRETTKIPIWIKSEYVTIVTSPFFRLEGEPSEGVQAASLWFPWVILVICFFSLIIFLFVKKLQFIAASFYLRNHQKREGGTEFRPLVEKEGVPELGSALGGESNSWN